MAATGTSSQDALQKATSDCEKRVTRITKENLYMVLALWMERFPLQFSKEQSFKSNNKSKKFKKVGVVFVLPTDRVLAADCSRDGVHGVARVMVNHCGKLEGCKVFVSRKPCSLCAKLLVQSRVSRVFYLPIEPESEDEGELARADNLFKVSPVGQSIFVPCVEERVLTKDEKRLPETITPEDVGICQAKLFEEYWWRTQWIERAQKCLPWPCLYTRMTSQVEKDFKSLMKWIAVSKSPMDKNIVFRRVKITKEFDAISDVNEYPDFEMARHMMIFAKMLARQTDDPKTGVGAVIVKGKDSAVEIATLGWNGFPSKALYGEFPRASDDDAAPETKFPYVIHAEQNALLVRNTKDLTDGVLFVTKPPCDECAPLIKLSGIKTVVVGETIKQSQGGELTYGLIREYIREGIVTCYQMETRRTPAKRSASYPEIRMKYKSRRLSVKV